jgi:hypothetical protein
VADPGVKMECCGGKGVLGWTADLRERMQGTSRAFRTRITMVSYL